MAQLATINPLNQFFSLGGSPLNNGKLYFGEEGKDPEQFPIQMYWDEAGLVPALQPIRTTSGYPSRSGSPAILYCASKYSLRVRQSNDVQVFYIPEAGSDAAEAFSAFSPSNLTPSYVSANVFTVTGNQTVALPRGLRLKMEVTAGTVYGTVLSSIYGALTTVTMVMDPGDALDAGLDSFQVGFSPVNDAIPRGIFPTIPQIAGHLYGLTFSTAGSSATMSIAAGVCTDSTNAAVITTIALDKTTSNFVAGDAAGGKFRAAAIANNATYHWYAVWSPTTGESDIGFSTVATGLVSTDYVAGGGNLPDKFTMFAYLKPWRTNGSAQWVSWIERGGNFFEFVTPILDIDHVVTVTTAVTEVLASVPTGVKVKVKFAGGVNNGSAANLAYFRFSALDTADLAPNSTTAPLTQQNYSISATGGSEVAYATHEIWTDTAASIRGRVSAAAAAISIRASVEGFYFYR